MKKLDPLLKVLAAEQHFYLQTHNFPDHDAVAAAFAMQNFLSTHGLSTSIIYEGTIQRDSLKRLITELEIPLKPTAEYILTAADKIVIIDGCKGNKNVTDLIGDEIGIIDHHEVISPEDVPFADIRSTYGSCSTIIYDYFTEYDIEIPRKVATALVTGLLVDTAQLTRGVCQKDIEAYSTLYLLADIGLVNSILRNNIQQKDLKFYRDAIDQVRITGGLAFCYFAQGCNQNLLGILGDFFLSLREIDFVFLCARNGQSVNFSVRSEEKKWNAAAVIQMILSGIGFGGGHADMAGGIITNPSAFQEEEIFNRTKYALGI